MGEEVLAVTGAAGECWPVLATSVLEAVRQWHGKDKRAFRRARWQVQVGRGARGPTDRAVRRRQGAVVLVVEGMRWQRRVI